jgi:N-acetylneuraminate synthase
MIAAIRDVESAMGDGRKIPAPEELGNRSVARRSLVVTKFVRRGERFSADNLGVKRPGVGVSPMEFWTYLDQVATRDYDVDEAIDQ